MKFETKRSLQAFILTLIFIIFLLIIKGFNNFGDFIIKAFSCFIFSGIIIVIWEDINKNKNRTVSNKEFLNGIESFEKGIEYYQERDFQNALIYFNKAIEYNYEENIYTYRADCLFELGINKQAIQDYNKAISQEPDDCNLWYMRSQVKKANNDLDGEIEDLETAIRLSKNDTKLNEEYFKEAQKMGWVDGHTSLYQGCLLSSKSEKRRKSKHRDFK